MSDVRDSVYKALRLVYPKSRRSQVTGIVRNTYSVRQVDCIVCGQSITCCNRYPETKAVYRFRVTHNKQCGAKLLAATAEGLTP